MLISTVLATSIAASCFGVLVLAMSARVLARLSHKPHYRILHGQWIRALGLLLALLLVHMLLLEFAGGPDVRGLVDVLGASIRSFALGFAAAGLVAVGLASAGTYALGVLRLPDDYIARSGFRMGAVVALVGLALLPLAFGPSWLTLACSLVVALALFASLSAFLWRRHPREVPWQLRAFVGAAPIGVLLLLLLAAMVVAPLPPVGSGHATVTLVDLVLLAVTALLLFRTMRQRPDLRSLEARLVDAHRIGRHSVDNPLSTGIPRHAGR